MGQTRSIASAGPNPSVSAAGARRRVLSLWLRWLAAVPIVGLGAAVRAAFLGDLGTRIAFLTFYPAVMLAALYGGLPAGILATAVSALLTTYWIQGGRLDSAVPGRRTRAESWS